MFGPKHKVLENFAYIISKVEKIYFKSLCFKFIMSQIAKIILVFKTWGEIFLKM